VALISSSIFHEVYSQDTNIISREIKWQTGGSIELHSNRESDRVCTIVTQKDKTIDLVCGTDVLSFSIVSISGTW
jgi:hypothetical protein